MDFETMQHEITCPVYRLKVIVNKSYQLIGGLGSADVTRVYVGDYCLETRCIADCSVGLTNIVERLY